MKGEWSKHPFRVWYNFGTEIWITVFGIRKNAMPVFIQCWMYRRKLGRSRNPFWRSLWHLKQRPCSNCYYNSLFFGCLELGTTLAPRSKEWQTIRCCGWFLRLRLVLDVSQKLFSLPTQVLPTLWATIQRVVNVTRTLESESCVEMPRPKGAKPSIWHHPERESELWHPKTIENVAITNNMN